MPGRRYNADYIEEVLTATIASGASLSDEIDTGGCTVVMIETPAGFDGTALTFQGGSGAGALANMYNESVSEINIPAAASRCIKITYPAMFLGVHRLKLRSGTAATPTNQADTDAVIKVTVRA